MVEARSIIIGFNSVIREELCFDIGQENRLINLSSGIRRFKEGHAMELEDSQSQCYNYKELLRVEREKHAISKDKLKMLVREINKLREHLKNSKESQLAQKSMSAQLLAYKKLQKQDAECKKRFEEECAKISAELVSTQKINEGTIKELNEEICRYKALLKEKIADPNKYFDIKFQRMEAELKQTQNEKEMLKKQNNNLSNECKKLKEDMDETVKQLLVICLLHK